MRKAIRQITLSIFLAVGTVFSQPDSRFRPFDWVVYKGGNEVTTITEGYTYAYLGTKSGGINRLNLFGSYFEEPLTVAQGIKSNNINAVHFDKITGLLWVATTNHVQFSNSREGNWFPIDLQSIGLSRFDTVRRIGSSKRFVWLEARSSYIKIDNSSGFLIGIFPNPDEMGIEWSSGKFRDETELNKILMNFSFFDGWVYNGNQLIDGYGRVTGISSGFLGKHGNVYLASNDGTIFLGTKTMQAFSPIYTGLRNNDVNTILGDDDYLWVGSQDFINSKGISKFDTKTLTSEFYSFEEVINMYPTPIYSFFYHKNNLYAGGDGLILYFNSKENFWRTLGPDRGIPSADIINLYGNDTHLWIGSSQGLDRISISTLRTDDAGIENIFSNVSVNEIDSVDNCIWFGTSSGLVIYSSIDSKLMQMEDIGRKNFSQPLFNVTSICENDNAIYVLCDIGIVKFDVIEREWDIVLNSAVYRNANAISMGINKKFIFLGLKDGLMKINKRSGLVREYFFPFLKNVNDIYINGKQIWLGTSNGLVKFLWKRDL